MPVVTLNYSNTAVNDAFIYQTNPTTNYVSGETLAVGSASNTNSVFRSLLKFELGLIPNNAIINSAVLTLTKTNTITTNRTMNIHLITSSWVDASATWSFAPSFDNSVKVSVDLGTTIVPISIDIKSIVQSWVNGTPNYGLLLKDSDESILSTSSYFGSINNTTAGNRPTLVIDYTIPVTGKKQVEYVGLGTPTFTSSATSISLPKPTGVMAGDTILAVVRVAGNAIITPPVGFTGIINVYTGGSQKFCVFYKKLDGSEPSSLSFSVPSGYALQGYLIGFRNVKTVSGNNGSVKVNQVNTPNVYPFSSPSLSTQDNMLLLLNERFGNTNTIDPPKNYSEVVDQSAGAGTSQASYTYLHGKTSQTTAEMTSTGTSTSFETVSAWVALEPITNNAPTIALSSPTDNLVLSEGNTFPVDGSANDTDNGNVVTIWYKINSGTTRALHSGVSNGSAPISFLKNLTYSNKRLYDGATDIVGADLAENTTHTLSVWADDGQSGVSAVVTKSFTVNHNKVPVLTVDSIISPLTGLIPSDSITISGAAAEPDGNMLSVKAKINSGIEHTLISEVSNGNWLFTFPVSSLQDGSNTITITATDQFGSSVTKTFLIANAIVKTPLKMGVARYKVLPPLGTAKEILAWLKIEKGDLTVLGEASFVDAGQPEQYFAMTKSSVDLTPTVSEDEFIGTVATPKADIIFKQVFVRNDANSTQAATSLVGVIE